MEAVAKAPSSDDFELQQIIGNGAMGVVWQAAAKNDPAQKYAVKIIDKSKLSDKKAVQRVLVEREIMVNLKPHPFIVRLHYAFQDDTRLFFVMDLLKEDLYTMVRNRPDKRIPVDGVRLYMAEMMLALEYLHSQKLIFRDLKLENVLVSASGHLRIADFGMATYTSRQLGTHIIGTPSYFSPEMIQGNEHSVTMDVWAYGIIAFELLCGCHPFDDSGDPQRLFVSIMRDDLQFPHSNDGFDADAMDIISQLLIKDPEDRLGCNGWDQLRTHPFLASLDWKDVYNEKYTPPTKPRSSSTDAGTKKEAIDSLAQQFKTYVSPHSSPCSSPRNSICSSSSAEDRHILGNMAMAPENGIKLIRNVSKHSVLKKSYPKMTDFGDDDNTISRSKSIHTSISDDDELEDELHPLGRNSFRSSSNSPGGRLLQITKTPPFSPGGRRLQITKSPPFSTGAYRSLPGSTAQKQGMGSASPKQKLQEANKQHRVAISKETLTDFQLKEMEEHLRHIARTSKVFPPNCTFAKVSLVSQKFIWACPFQEAMMGGPVVGMDPADFTTCVSDRKRVERLFSDAFEAPNGFTASAEVSLEPSMCHRQIPAFAAKVIVRKRSTADLKGLKEEMGTSVDPDQVLLWCQYRIPPGES